MADTTPAFRGILIKNVVDLISEMPPAKARAVEAGIPAAIRQELKDASALSWIPVEHTLAVTSAALAVLSPKEFDELYEQAGMRYMKSPMAQSVVGFVAKVTGLSPKQVVKSNVVSWGMITRNCGVQTFRDLPSPTEADLVWKEVPPVILSLPAYVRTFALGMALIYSITKVKGTIVPVVDLPAKQIVFHFKWH